MKRRKRTETLIKGSQNIAMDWAKELESLYEVQMIEKPHHGLVMVKVRENGEKSRFYLGEVFVTEAKVKINDCFGIGIVRGDKADLSYALAIIDAACSCRLKENNKWHDLLLEEEERIRNEEALKMEKIRRTEVSFETMEP